MSVIIIIGGSGSVKSKVDEMNTAASHGWSKSTVEAAEALFAEFISDCETFMANHPTS